MAHRIRRPSTARPTADLGFQVRTIRKSLGVTHEVLAAKAKMRAPQISLLETGHNVESRQYEAIAKALGFRTALELFRASDADPLRKQLDRAWLLLDDTQKQRTLRFLNTLILEG
jgi:transcriptional regulator with XRE-family HTH domain